MNGLNIPIEFKMNFPRKSTCTELTLTLLIGEWGTASYIAIWNKQKWVDYISKQPNETNGEVIIQTIIFV